MEENIMEIVILYGFICSGKSTIAKKYGNLGYTIINYDVDEAGFTRNIEQSIRKKESLVIDAPIWNINQLACLSAKCCHYGAEHSVLKVHVLPHLELIEIVSKVEKRWILEPDHINHRQYNESLDLCIEDMKSRF